MADIEELRRNLERLPEDLRRHILLSADDPRLLLNLCATSQSFRDLLGTPSALHIGRGGWRRVYDMLDPCAVFLGPAAFEDPESCDGYLQHAERFSADGAQPGFLRLAHALANDSCAECGEVTRWMAYREGEVGLTRCCKDCPLDGDEEKTEQVVLINAFLFQREPFIEINSAGEEDALLTLYAAVQEAADGDTIALRGAFVFDDEDGFHMNRRGRAVRLLGLDPASAKASLHVSSNCLEVYAPGVMCENLSLSSGEMLESEEEADGELHFAGVYPIHVAPTPGMPSQIDGSPSLILKDCTVEGRCGSAMVLGKGVHCACLRSRFSSDYFGICAVQARTVVRISGCVFDNISPWRLTETLMVRGRHCSDATESALAAANVFNGLQISSWGIILLENSADEDGSTILLV